MPRATGSCAIDAQPHIDSGVQKGLQRCNACSTTAASSAWHMSVHPPLLMLPTISSASADVARTHTYGITSMLRLINDTHRDRESACCLPDASRKFEDGQCATPIPFSAICCTSALSRKQQCANQTSSPSHSTSLRSSQHRISGISSWQI